MNTYSTYTFAIAYVFKWKHLYDSGVMLYVSWQYIPKDKNSIYVYTVHWVVEGFLYEFIHTVTIYCQKTLQCIWHLNLPLFCQIRENCKQGKSCLRQPVCISVVGFKGEEGEGLGTYTLPTNDPIINCSGVVFISSTIIFPFIWQIERLLCEEIRIIFRRKNTVLQIFFAGYFLQ